MVQPRFEAEFKGLGEEGQSVRNPAQHFPLSSLQHLVHVLI